MINPICPILETKNLAIGYRLPPAPPKVLIKNLNFQVYSGDMICLMGPNGCGKTTLFRTLSALSPRLNGQIIIDSKDIKDYDELDLAKKISIVLTEKLDLINISVEELIALGRFPYTNFFGKLSGNDQKRINETIELLNFQHLRKENFNQLSDGQKQKVLIGRALAQDTPIIFLDEPTTFLDIPKKIEIFQLLKRIARNNNIAVLFSSHDWEMVLEMATKVWLINESGKLVDGLPEDLILNGEIEKCFDHPQFTFDPLRGNFKTQKEHKKHGKHRDTAVCVLGSSKIKLIWTIHVLEKVGLSVYTEQRDNIPTIEIDHSGWLLTIGNKTINCLSLEDLLIKLGTF